MTDRQIEIRKLTILSLYLKELGALVGRTVTSDELLPYQEAVLLRDKLKQISKEQVARFCIPFEQRNSHAFSTMIEQLYCLNNSPVVLWLPKGNECGLLSITSIKQINFDFSFNLNPEGILTIATRDGRDRLLLDFNDEDDGKQLLEIELYGENWSLATLT